MVGTKKWVFMQALLLTIVVFIAGMYAGVIFEEKKFSQANAYFTSSEVSLMDVLALNELMSSKGITCTDFTKSNFDLLDRVYEEAIKLEEYEASGKITESIKSEHKKYDMMRTYLWINFIKLKEKCPTQYHTIVYLYNYNQEDLVKKAEQNVWSRILYEIKQDKGNKVALLPIAADNNLSSLKVLIADKKITEYPVVIIDEKYVFSDLTSAEELEKYLQ